MNSAFFIGRTILVGVMLLGCLGETAAQQQPAAPATGKVALTLEGMAGVSFGDRMVAFNVGGPNLMLQMGKNWRAGLAAFPSFFVKQGKTGARLGVGGRVDYRNFVLFSSFYHFDTRGYWVGTAGFGYKFHKKAH